MTARVSFGAGGPMKPAKPTLILVHGAWHGIWCWERLLPQLEERGIAVRSVDLPSVSRGDTGSARKSSGRAVGLRDDANAVRAVIESVGAGAPVALCGHSYGGMVISQAGSHPRVSRLIYLCAFMPEPRQSLVAIGGNRHAPWIRMLDDEMTLPEVSLAGEVFYNDCDAATREWASARLAPQFNAAFIAPVARPAWRAIPSTYIVCARDRALPPDLQRRVFAPRAERSMELDAGHSPFLSQPAALAHALARALEPGHHETGV